jgi:hypothetical protein
MSVVFKAKLKPQKFKFCNTLCVTEIVEIILMAACYTECSSNCDVNSISSSLSTTSSVSTNGGEIPSLRDLSAEAAARQDLKKVLIVDARSYAAAVGNRQDMRAHLVLVNYVLSLGGILLFSLFIFIFHFFKIEMMRTHVVAVAALGAPTAYLVPTP